jgi:NAD(P)-dependent dehydrogenase (short-subunit alcohol dehydrogenase family)
VVVIAGGHGKIALRLTQRLCARGEAVVGLIRNPDHADDVRSWGARPVRCDLEHASVPEVVAAIAGASAVVFAAGAGPGSGAERKLTMDRDGANRRVRVELEPFRGQIPRADVAAVLDAVLQETRAAHRTLYVNAGTMAIAQALEAVL